MTHDRSMQVESSALPERRWPKANPQLYLKALILEEIMRDQSKAPEIAARLQREDPELLMELVEFIQSQQGGKAEG